MAAEHDTPCGEVALLAFSIADALPIDEVRAAPSVPFPMIAIGASAGGVDALRCLLRALPADIGCAFIVATHLDLVSCRNLLIYMRPPLQRRALQTFHFAFESDRFLFLRKAETVGALGRDPFQLASKQYRIHRRVGLARHVMPSLAGAAGTRDPSMHACVAARRGTDRERTLQAVREEAHATSPPMSSGAEPRPNDLRG